MENHGNSTGNSNLTAEQIDRRENHRRNTEIENYLKEAGVDATLSTRRKQIHVYLPFYNGPVRSDFSDLIVESHEEQLKRTTKATPIVNSVLRGYGFKHSGDWNQVNESQVAKVYIPYTKEELNQERPVNQEH